MAIKESALSLITSIAQGDWIRAVTSAGASRRVTVANLAKAIVESYTGSSLAGSAQSVKSALDSLNSKIPTRVNYRVASATASSWAGRYYQDVDVSSVIPSNKRIVAVTLGSATSGGVLSVWLQDETVVRLIDTSDFSGKALQIYLELI